MNQPLHHESRPISRSALGRSTLLRRFIQSPVLAIGMLCTLFAAPSEAALVDCLNLKILRVTSESVREDAFVFQNKLVVEVSDQNGNQTMCGGGMYLYLPATDSNYNRIMALATTALITGRSVTLAVNNSAANTLNLGFGTAVLLAFVTLQ